MNNEELIERIHATTGYSLFDEDVIAVIKLITNHNREQFKRDAPCAYACEKKAIEIDTRMKTVEKCREKAVEAVEKSMDDVKGFGDWADGVVEGHLEAIEAINKALGGSDDIHIN